jgi:hypothetical protein
MSRNRTLIFNVTDIDGVLLDQQSITREEWQDIVDSPLMAHVFVNDFEVGR